MRPVVAGVGFIETPILSGGVSTRTSALDAVIFGVDVQSGDVRGGAPSYALVQFDGEVRGRDVVSLRKLRRLVADEEPTILAIDNVFELAEDANALVHLLRELPDATSLVQVTGDQSPEPLSRVAHRHDVPYDSSPMGEAEAAARLAAANVGYRVSAFEAASEIRVTRGRSPGRGGSSEDRFTRRIHGAVRSRGREVTRTLEQTNLDFTREITEKFGGWSRAVFQVDAPPDDVPVSAERAGDVRVEIEPMRSSGIEFEPLVTRREHVIVGIDPGTSVAVGLVDLNGSVLDVWSSRTASMDDVVEWIIHRGQPVIVAADVAEMPSTVEQIRRSFDATGWTPSSDLPVDEKLHRCRDAAVDNDHERDALAAALFAFDGHAEQLAQIAERTPPGVAWERVANLVLSDGITIDAAMDRLRDDPEPESVPAPPEPADPSPQRRRIHTLKQRVQRQESHIEDLRQRLDERDAEIERLEEQLRQARTEERRSVRRERAVTRLERANRRLERELESAEDQVESLEEKVERMKALWRLDHSNFADVEEVQADLVPVKPVEKFTVDAIDAADADYGLAPDDVVYLRDATGAGAAAARRLASVDPRVVLIAGGLSDASETVLWEAQVPIGSIDEVAMQEVDELAVARESDVDAVIERWHVQAEQRRLEQKRALVDELIDEQRRGQS